MLKTSHITWEYRLLQGRCVIEGIIFIACGTDHSDIERGANVGKLCSMYGIFTYIYPKNCPNVGKYPIHGASGYIYIYICVCVFTLVRNQLQTGMRIHAVNWTCRRILDTLLLRWAMELVNWLVNGSTNWDCLGVTNPQLLTRNRVFPMAHLSTVIC